MTAKAQRFPSLDGLRAISIIVVILAHIVFQYKYQGIFETLSQVRGVRTVLAFLHDGAFAVNMFFMISGMLITSLILQEERVTNHFSLKNFYIRRFLRIFPAYYFFLLVYAVLQMAGVFSLTASSWLTSITYTKYFDPTADWLTSHIWSLSVEEHFYLILPFTFLASAKTRTTIVWAMAIVPMFIRVLSYYHPLTLADELTIFTRIDSIATGCLLAIYKDEILKRIVPYWKILFWGSFIYLVFSRNFHAIAEKFHIGFIALPHGTGVNIAIAIILMYSLFHTQGLWFRFLNGRIISYIGTLSYSLYLWQQFFIHNTGQWYNQFPQNIAGLVLAAMGSYYLIEKPFLRFKSKFSSTKS